MRESREILGDELGGYGGGWSDKPASPKSDNAACRRDNEMKEAPFFQMSEEQLKAFLEKVKGDTTLQEKLKAAVDADAVTAIAKEAGFSISADDLKDFKNAQFSEISDEELEGVAGGAVRQFETAHCVCTFSCSTMHHGC